MHVFDKNELQDSCAAPRLCSLQDLACARSLALPPSPASDAIHPDWKAADLTQAITRRIETASGAYRLWAAIPDAEPPPGGFPLVWVLDGAGLFPHIAETARRLWRRPDATGVVPAVIAGLDHEPGETARRYSDYTPGPPQTLEPAMSEASFGGDGRLLGVLGGPALAAVSAITPLDRKRQFLVGHSLSALFAVQVLAENPRAFAGVVAISPSLWWNPRLLNDSLEAMTDQGQRGFLAVGEREQPITIATEADARRNRRKMVTRVREAGARIAGILPPERFECVVATDEDHASTPIALAPRFLRFLLKPT